MEAELVALATAGATALVQQMAAEGWAQARERVVAFFARRRGAGEEEALAGELEVSRGELLAAREEGDDSGAVDVEAEWRVRLRRLLREDPAAAEELRELVDAWREESGGVRVRDVHNSITGGVHHGTVIQAGVIAGLTREGRRDARQDGRRGGRAPDDH
ncbi:hypothetical protein [Streptomyces sp. MST-110588]|uniref:hypothetical protein n=1 Tax=Streptomyces sp. MST-110588 TaxID=2833628 RepID=UPI001F5C1F0B|nr:hypothetical protein [Streptomyces sp. MST-110588]UNO42682.1 hypothetical protein KGS77_28035 [Streptomyces sp. MST-110588]